MARRLVSRFYVVMLVGLVAAPTSDAARRPAVALDRLQSAASRFRTREQSTQHSGMALRLIAFGAHPHIADLASRHVLLGLPSAADRHKANDRILIRTGSVISYNKSRSAPNWVSWSLR